MSQHKRTSERSCSNPGLSRRRFIAGAGSAAVSFSVVEPTVARSYSANSKVALGIVGCGSRGAWITNLFKQHGGYDIVAAADYFPDRVTNVGDKFGVKPASRYTGLSGYHRMLEQGPDAVAIESPPYFHPEHAAAAVDAGRHVYLAKPIAVDVPGCQSIARSGKKASDNKLCFIVDFQTRADPFYREALGKVREGALGKFVFGEATYHASNPWVRMHPDWESDPQNPEMRLRAWGLDNVLSGDIITEQNIHTLDVMNWIMGQEPVCADGTGGRTVRSLGTCWDHFTVLFQYPENVGVTFSSRQFQGHGTQPEGIRNRMFGAAGVLETQYGGQVLIRGEHFYRGGKSPGIFKDGAVANIAAFHKDILEKSCENPTVQPSVRSNLLTVFGRTAAYTGDRVYWDQFMRSDEKLDPKLKGLKS